MGSTVEIGALIVRTPDVRGGRPRVAGTGVTVRRIIGWYQLVLTPEEIATEIPHLTLAQVYAALTYYHANRGEIDADMNAEDAEADQLEQQNGLAADMPCCSGSISTRTPCATPWSSPSALEAPTCKRPWRQA